MGGGSYRREIDGLRAIAVAAVVLYHAGVGFTGFVGVDIFFVISGYLITLLLVTERSETGRVDLIAFYSRRVRRILPATVVVIVIVVAAAPWFLSPQEVSMASRSAGAAALFFANLFFQQTTGGYFDPAVEQLPLLHLWSLSVEEQFYLLWPALLMTLPRRHILPALIGLGIGSFALAEWLMSADPQAAFYQAPARAWELAAGGVVAVLPRRPLPRVAIPLGLIIILGACLGTAEHFPGFGALPAVLGACLIIAAVHGGASDRILSSKPLVGLGLISFSVYLWHWPLLAFYSASSIGPGATGMRLALCGAAILLGVLSFHLVEQPFRGAGLPIRKVLITGVGVSVATAMAAIMFSYSTAGSLLLDDSREVLASLTERDILPPAATASNPRVAVWGDSYAHMWQPLGWVIANKRDEAALNFSFAGCPPLLGYLVEQSKAEACIAHNAAVVARVRHFDTVILAFNWQRYQNDDPGNSARLEAALRDTLGGLSTVRRVLIIAPTPVMQDDLPKCIRLGRECGVTRIAFENSVRAIRVIMVRSMAGHQNASSVDPTGYLCTSSQCPGFRDGVALYSDHSHLTATAAKSAARWLQR